MNSLWIHSAGNCHACLRGQHANTLLGDYLKPGKSKDIQRHCVRLLLRAVQGIPVSFSCQDTREASGGDSVPPQSANALILWRGIEPFLLDMLASSEDSMSLRSEVFIWRQSLPRKEQPYKQLLKQQD